jgi:hypothetical protein
MSRMLIVIGTVAMALIGACVSLTVSVHALQDEVKKLQTRVAADGAAADAIAKFEKDFFAGQAALAQAQQYAAEQARKKQAGEIGADVMSLPASGVHRTINWAQDKKTE